MTEPGSFRPARESDTDAILAFQKRYYDEDGYPYSEARSRRAIRTLIRNPEYGRIWVISKESGVAGYLAVTLGYSLEYGGRDAFVDELFIGASARGRGLGREAMRIAETWCREVGVRALHLEVETHREPAVRLYERSGFTDHGRRLMTKLLDA